MTSVSAKQLLLLHQPFGQGTRCPACLQLQLLCDQSQYDHPGSSRIIQDAVLQLAFGCAYRARAIAQGLQVVLTITSDLTAHQLRQQGVNHRMSSTQRQSCSSYSTCALQCNTVASQTYSMMTQRACCNSRSNSMQETCAPVTGVQLWLHHRLTLTQRQCHSPCITPSQMHSTRTPRACSNSQ